MSRTSERRAQRMEALRKQDEPTGLARLLRNRNVLIIGGGLLLIVALAAVVAAAAGANQPAVAPLTPGAATAPAAGFTPGADVIGKEMAVPNMGGQHIAVGQPHAPYNSLPPTSGPHYDTPADWNTPVDKVVPEEQWVHNLEHSGVVALYNCPQGCPDLLAKLAAFKQTGVRSKFGYVKLLVQPYDKLPNKLTLVAWNFYLRLADYDDAALRTFFTAHQDKGPEPDTP